MIATLLGGVVQGIGGWFKERARTKTVQAKAKAKLAQAHMQAKIAYLQRQAKAEGDWDMEALRQAQFSWKDEWFVLLLSAPFIGSFLPGIQDYVLAGWEYIALAPQWYQWSFLGAVTASFGLRWMVRAWLPPGKPQGKLQGKLPVKKANQERTDIG